MLADDDWNDEIRYHGLPKFEYANTIAWQHAGASSSHAQSAGGYFAPTRAVIFSGLYAIRTGHAPLIQTIKFHRLTAKQN